MAMGKIFISTEAFRNVLTWKYKDIATVATDKYFVISYFTQSVWWGLPRLFNIQMKHSKQQSWFGFQKFMLTTTPYLKFSFDSM